MFLFVLLDVLIEFVCWSICIIKTIRTSRREPNGNKKRKKKKSKKIYQQSIGILNKKKETNRLELIEACAVQRRPSNRIDLSFIEKHRSMLLSIKHIFLLMVFNSFSQVITVENGTNHRRILTSSCSNESSRKNKNLKDY